MGNYPLFVNNRFTSLEKMEKRCNDEPDAQYVTGEVKSLLRTIRELKNALTEESEKNKILNELITKDFKYVWYFKDNGTFSNSWPDENDKGSLSVGALAKSAEKNENAVLLQYREVTETNFEFVMPMRIA